MTEPTSTNARAAIRVFLIEDSRPIRDMIIEDLNSIPEILFAGYSETESEALKTLMREEFDVIIFDIQLQQGNGINLLRAMVRSNIQPQALKIVFSNHVGTSYRRLCEQYGVRYFFDKSSEFLGLHLTLTEIGSRKIGIS